MAGKKHVEVIGFNIMVPGGCQYKGWKGPIDAVEADRLAALDPPSVKIVGSGGGAAETATETPADDPGENDGGSRRRSRRGNG